MQTSPSFPTTAPLPSGTRAQPGRRVTDAPTRMFHWLFALSFVGAYLTAESEHWRLLHVTLGYTLAGLLAFRLVYGLVGPRQARLGVLRRKLAGGPDWLRSTAQAWRDGALRRINWRQGQNLLMALAIAALLLLVVPLTLSGYANYNDWGELLDGVPLIGGLLGSDALAELHEFFGNAFLAVVLAHLGLIAGLSLIRRQNQAAPMLTGRTQGRGPDLVRHNRSGLAALLLAAVLGFAAWQHMTSPQGLLPQLGQPGAAWQGDRGDDDDD